MTNGVMVDPKEKRRIGRILESKTWTFAKTMPQMPHWHSHVSRGGWASLAEMHEVSAFMREHGTEEWFGRRSFMYFYVNGYKYWTMDEHIKDVTLINRSFRGVVPHPADDMGDFCAGMSADPALATILGAIGDTAGKTVLDIHGGTGWLFDHLVDPQGYRLIEPSGLLLQPFLEQQNDNPVVKVLNTPLQDFVGPEYDIAVFLGQRASWELESVWMQDIPNLVKPGGRWVISFHNTQEVPAGMGGEVIEAGEWILLAGTRED